MQSENTSMSKPKRIKPLNLRGASFSAAATRLTRQLLADEATMQKLIAHKLELPTPGDHRARRGFEALIQACSQDIVNSRKFRKRLAAEIKNTNS
jgi:hypothetical protein